MGDFKKYGVVYILIFLVAALLVVTVFFPNIKLSGLQQATKLEQTAASPTVLASITNEVAIIIDFGNGKKIENKLIAFSAYDALKKTLDKEKIEIKVKEYDFGLFVEQIDDRKNTTDLAWIYYVNSQAGDVASDKKEIKPGDKVEWKYEKPSY